MGGHLEAVEIFVKVVATGSFSEAARVLGVSKSLVSRQVKALEDRLGARLINRTTRKIALTEAGEAFAARCAEALAGLEAAEAAVGQLQGEVRGTLRLSVPMSFGVRYLAPIIPAFLARHRGLHAEVSYADRRVDLIEEGYDLAVRVGELEDSTLIARRLASTRRHAVASPDYLAARGTPDHPTALRGHDCLLYRYQASGAAWRFRGPGGELSVRVEGPLLANNGDAIRAAAVSGLGVALLPDFLVCDDLRAGRLVSILSDWSEWRSAVWAIYPHHRHLAAKVRLFVDFLAARFGGDAPPWHVEPGTGPHDPTSASQTPSPGR